MHDNKNAPFKYLFIAAFIALCFGCAASPAIDNVTDERYEISDNARRNLVDYIQLALTGSDSPVRVSFEGTCSQADRYRYMGVIFPELNITTPVEEGSDVERIRSIFPNNGKVSISQGEDSIIRVRIGNPDEEILKTRIKSVSFDIDTRFNAHLAVGTINGAPEVLASREKFGTDVPLQFSTGLLHAPLYNNPHLPETLEDVTMDEALDLVVTTFGDIVVFGACSNKYMLDTYWRGE